MGQHQFPLWRQKPERFQMFEGRTRCFLFSQKAGRVAFRTVRNQPFTEQHVSGSGTDAQDTGRVFLVAEKCQFFRGALYLSVSAQAAVRIG
jgi:hypothetical protein